jgi:hypothetical protein
MEQLAHFAFRRPRKRRESVADRRLLLPIGEQWQPRPQTRGNAGPPSCFAVVCRESAANLRDFWRKSSIPGLPKQQNPGDEGGSRQRCPSVSFCAIKNIAIWTTMIGVQDPGCAGPAIRLVATGFPLAREWRLRKVQRQMRLPWAVRGAGLSAPGDGRMMAQTSRDPYHREKS